MKYFIFIILLFQGFNCCFAENNQNKIGYLLSSKNSNDKEVLFDDKNENNNNYYDGIYHGNLDSFNLLDIIRGFILAFIAFTVSFYYFFFNKNYCGYLYFTY